MNLILESGITSSSVQPSSWMARVLSRDNLSRALEQVELTKARRARRHDRRSTASVLAPTMAEHPAAVDPAGLPTTAGPASHHCQAKRRLKVASMIIRKLKAHIRVGIWTSGCGGD
jgi:hypothetical protein